jgi:hypothetical protein
VLAVRILYAYKFARVTELRVLTHTIKKNIDIDGEFYKQKLKIEKYLDL